jgi:tellurite resistance protein TerC
VAFAHDSIPAIISVTRSPFIVYTSNVFAILGLRASYFLMAALVPRLHFLSMGLAAVLVFIGVKMLGEPWFALTTGASLLTVLVLLGASVSASLLAPPPRGPRNGAATAGDGPASSPRSDAP